MVNYYDSIKPNYKRYGTTYAARYARVCRRGIEIVYLSNGDHLIVNKDGLWEGMVPITEATEIWWADVGLDNALSRAWHQYHRYGRHWWVIYF